MQSSRELIQKSSLRHGHLKSEDQDQSLIGFVWTKRKMAYLAAIPEYTSAGFSPATRLTAAAPNWKLNFQNKKI